MAGWRRAHDSPASAKPHPRAAPRKHLRDDEDEVSTSPSKRRRAQDRGRKQAETFETFDNYRPHNTHPSTRHPGPSRPFIDSDRTSTHTRQDRKNNRSSRIHSIRNLLAHDTLPGSVKLEKERELASLLFDQQKDKIKSESSKMITRYHKVRFFERKKAERKVRQLEKRRDAWLARSERGTADGLEGHRAGEVERLASERQAQEQLKKLEPLIREAKVDLSYTIYSPLNQKYISIFPAGPNSQIFLMPTKQQVMLSKEQREELQVMQDSTVGLTRLSDTTAKPPMWREVEKIMFPDGISNGKGEGSTDTMDIDIDATTREAAAQKKLELLREGKLTSNSHTALGNRELVSGNTRAVVEARKGTPLGKTDKSGSSKRRADAPASSAWGPKAGREAWIDEDGHLDADGIDSASDEDRARGGVRLDARGSNGNASEASDSDSDGFFER